MICSSKAIVIKSVDYRESSKIVTALTEKHGKIAFMARGARKPKSALSGKMQVGQMLEIEYYYKSTRSVQNIKEVSYWQRLSHIYTDFHKWAVAVASIETTQQLVQEGENNPDIFYFLANLLPWVEAAESNPGYIFPYILLRLADIMGIGLQLGGGLNHMNSEESMKANSPLHINVEDGALSPEASGSHAYRLTERQSQYVIWSLTGKSGKIVNLNLTTEELNDLIRYIDNYMRYHLDDLKPRISDNIFQQIL